MLKRIRELAYDTVANKIVARDHSGKKITVPFNSESSLSAPVGFYWEQNNPQVLTGEDGTYFLDMTSADLNLSYYPVPADDSIVWNPVSKTVDVNKGGLFFVEPYFSTDPAPEATAPITIIFAYDQADRAGRPDIRHRKLISSMADVENNYTEDLAQVQAGIEWTQHQLISLAAGVSFSLIIFSDETQSININWASLEFVRVT